MFALYVLRYNQLLLVDYTMNNDSLLTIDMDNAIAQ